MTQVDRDVPRPVVPLSYADGDGDSLRAIASLVRGVSWLVVLYNGFGLLAYAFEIGCYLWFRETVTPPFWSLMPTAPFVIAVPSCLVAAATMVGGVGCLRRREWGRSWVVRASAVAAVLGPLTRIAVVVFYQRSLGYWQYGIAYATSRYGTAAAVAAESAMMSVALWLFYRQRSVRRVFWQAQS